MFQTIIPVDHYRGTHLGSDGKDCAVKGHAEPRLDNKPPPTSKEAWCTLCKRPVVMTHAPWLSQR